MSADVQIESSYRDRQRALAFAELTALVLSVNGVRASLVGGVVQLVGHPEVILQTIASSARVRIGPGVDDAEAAAAAVSPSDGLGAVVSYRRGSGASDALVTLRLEAFATLLASHIERVTEA
jgi:hypothetical protein